MDPKPGYGFRGMACGWVVRAGRNGEHEEAALQNNIITIGWNGLDNLSSIQDYDLLRKHYSQVFSKETEPGSNWKCKNMEVFQRNRKG
jgi:predicted Mrr-cat superfamily restriction endonuclease